ncbi:ubiquinone anaerobic biosynthesis accessory factor UbiT [Hoeflea sp.]|uniref:ubiquinone anaerobic biosynthesis accessory factor UbiT n=1 Tax=Hoeflea sp. TaxID=1940281 RepID=UPI003A90FD23
MPRRTGGIAQGAPGQAAVASGKLPRILGILTAPLPLFPVQPILRRMVGEVTRKRPELFERLGPHVHSTYVIDVTELPFVLRLRPDPDAPGLTAHRRTEQLDPDATIAGPFSALFDVMDGTADSDALFFSRDISISGNTEAAVCLRSALDDLEGSIIEDLVHMSGPLYAPLRFALTRLRKAKPGDQP